MGIPSGIIFGLLSMLGYGLANAISKVPAREVGSERSVFLRGILVSLILFVVFLVFIGESKFSAGYILVALLIGILGYFPLLFYYKAVTCGNVGIVTTIANSSLVVTILLSVFFFNEILSSMQILSIIIILFGITLISINFRNIRGSDFFKKSSGVPFALLAIPLWGLVYFLAKLPIAHLGPYLSAFVFEFGVMAASFVHLKHIKAETSFPKAGKHMAYIVLLAIFIAAGTLFYNLGVNIADVSIIIAITYSNPFIAVLYGKFIYKEKIKPLQYLAILMIISGIVLVSLS